MTRAPLSILIQAELDRLGVTTAELSRRIAAAREPPADPRTVAVTLAQVFSAQPREKGARPRQLSEGLLVEIADALGLEVALIPKRPG